MRRTACAEIDRALVDDDGVDVHARAHAPARELGHTLEDRRPHVARLGLWSPEGNLVEVWDHFEHGEGADEGVGGLSA